MGQVVGRWLWAYRRSQRVLRRKKLALYRPERRKMKRERDRRGRYHEPIWKLQWSGWMVQVGWVVFIVTLS